MSPKHVRTRKSWLFRASYGLAGVVLGGVSAWMFVNDHDFLLATLLAGASLIALLNAVIGKP